MGVRATTAVWLACAAVGGLAAGCADGPRPQAAAPTRCGDERFPVYFAPASSALRPESLAVIRSAAGRVSGCRISAVDVTGVAAADAAGAALDPALAQTRAQAVAGALAQAGLPAPGFDLQVTGAAAAARGVRAPLARRTEVVVHAAPAT